MWNRFDHARPLRGRELEDTEALRGAIIALRFELLYTAVMYGLHSLQADGGRGAEAWREWLRWVEDLVLQRAQRHDRYRHGFEPDRWIYKAAGVLDGLDTERADDPFDEQSMQLWARERFEHLALRARPIELEAGEPLAEIKGRRSRAAKRLLASVQDSLVLASCPDAETRSKRAGATEILKALTAARDEGAWKVLLAK